MEVCTHIIVQLIKSFTSTESIIRNCGTLFMLREHILALYLNILVPSFHRPKCKIPATFSDLSQ